MSVEVPWQRGQNEIERPDKDRNKVDNSGKKPCRLNNKFLLLECLSVGASVYCYDLNRASILNSQAFLDLLQLQAAGSPDKHIRGIVLLVLVDLLS